MSVQVLPGDIFLTCDRGVAAAAVRAFQRSPGEPASAINHVGLFTTAGPADLALGVESLTVVKHHAIMPRYAAKKSYIAIFRFAGLTPEQRGRVAQKAVSYLGRKYGYHWIAAHALDRAIGGRYLFRRLAGMDNYAICSWLVSRAYSSVNVDFGVPENALQPDDIWDRVTDHPAFGWECVMPLQKAKTCCCLSDKGE
jgi:hypothetical protein